VCVLSLLRPRLNTDSPPSSSGKFEPPGAKTVTSYVIEREKENDPRWIALKAAQLRAQKAEEIAAQLPTGKDDLLCLAQSLLKRLVLDIFRSYRQTKRTKVHNLQELCSCYR